MSKSKIDWTKFSTEEIKVKMIELENAYNSIDNVLKMYLDKLDAVNKEYINAKKELEGRDDL